MVTSGPLSGTSLAIKRIPVLEDGANLAEVAKEIQLLRFLRHPNVVNILSVKGVEKFIEIGEHSRAQNPC